MTEMTDQPAGFVIPVFTRGDRMRKAREHVGIGQREFAALLGVTKATIGNCERDVHAPRPILIRAWSLATGVPVEWLETGTAPTDNPPAPFTVRHQGLEPRTRWFSVAADQIGCAA